MSFYWGESEKQAAKRDEKHQREMRRLFPLPPCLRDYFLGSGIAVHPLDMAYFGRLQGPRPATCARELHPDSPWHWDGRGTWWRS